MKIKETILIHGLGWALFSLDQIQELDKIAFSPITNSGEKNRAELIRAGTIVAKVIKEKFAQIQQGKEIGDLSSNFACNLIKTAIYYQLGRLKAKSYNEINGTSNCLPAENDITDKLITKIAAPILEEYLFRRKLQPFIEEKIHGKFQNPMLEKATSIALTSLLFSLIHLGDEIKTIRNEIGKSGLNTDTVSRLAGEIFKRRKRQLIGCFLSGISYELAKNTSGLMAAIVMHSAHNHNVI